MKQERLRWQKQQCYGDLSKKSHYLCQKFHILIDNQTTITN